MKLKFKKVANLLQTAATEEDATATLTAIKQAVAYGIVKADEELQQCIWALTFDREADGWIDYRSMELVISPVFYRGQNKNY